MWPPLAARRDLFFVPRFTRPADGGLQCPSCRADAEALGWAWKFVLTLEDDSGARLNVGVLGADAVS